MQKSLAVVLAASAVSAVLLGGSPAQAQEYPWCAQYGGTFGGGGRNCGFVSYRQCMAAISGNGGFCERNLFFRGPDVRADERPAPRRPYRRD
jgi:hypothetical protein